MGRLLILTLSVAAWGANAFAVVGVLNELAAAKGVSVPEAGQVQTAFVLTTALMGPVLAVVLRGVDRQRLLAGGLALMALSALACAATTSFGALLVARVAAGLAAALILPLSTAMVQTLAAPERRGQATAIVMLGVPFSLLLAGPASTALGASFGWPASFLFAGAMAGIAAVLVLVGLPRAPGVAGRFIPLSREALTRLTPLWTATLLSFVGTFSLTSYMSPIAARLAGVSAGQVGLFQVAIGLGAIAGILLGGRAADRGAGVPRLAAGLLVIAASTASTAAAFAGSHPSVLGGAVLAGSLFVGAAAMFSLMPVVQLRLLQAAGVSAPLALALNGSSSALGQAAGALFGGVAIAAFGLPGAPALGAAAALLGAGLLWFIARPARAAEPTVAA